jgi:Fe(3+) dicitrate transport protein
VKSNQVEYVPNVNWKAGIQASYRSFKLTYQFSYLSKQYTEATNTNVNDFTAVNGPVPAYKLMDISAGWSYRWLLLEASMNNVANVAYYTRRATGYPGPGIIPGDGRSYYLTVGVKF